MNQNMTRIVVAGAVSVAGLALAMQGTASADRGDAGIGAVRAWTAKYHDIDVAIADGFVPTDECVPGMGYHYVNFERFDTEFEPSRPEALLYAAVAAGSHGGSDVFKMLLEAVEKMTGLKADAEQVAPARHVVEAKMKRAMEEFRMRRFGKAAEECLNALHIEPQNAKALARLGSIYFVMGQREQAFKMWRASLQKNPRNAELRTFLYALRKPASP
jgi:tetratricopeptide (TPR) repeat protein